MHRVNLILNNDYFKNNLSKNLLEECNRKFCKHDLEHSLSVARIGYIINLEDNLNINKEIIYATALLHDIGRNMEYEKGVPHERASAIISKSILEDCEFNDEEIGYILNAILSHRKNNSDNSLGELLYKADKVSRNCFNCSSYKECNWDKNKMNFKIIV